MGAFSNLQIGFRRWAWQRAFKGTWKRRAIEAEREVQLLRQGAAVDVPAAYKNGWQAGWEEALRIAGFQFTGFKWPIPEENNDD